MIFIPAIIFESSLGLDWYTFRREFWQIIMLAAPGVLISTVLTAITFLYVLDYQEIFTWGQALMLGAVLSAIDPVAVVSLLKDLGTSKRFSTIIEGESVVNDGTAMVLFVVMLKAAKGDTLEPGDIIIHLLRLSLGGPAMGILFGIAMARILKHIYDDFILEITITVVTTYLLYYTCEESGAEVSGILGLLAMGLYMSAWGKITISHESEHQMHVIWKFLSYIAETLLFMLSGIIIGAKIFTDSTISGSDWGKQFAFLGLMEINRALMVLFLYPSLYWWGYRVSWRQAVVMTHAGLRGSIAMCLALLVQHEDLPKDVKHLVLFHTAGLAFFSILINGSTTKLLLVKLGLAHTSKVEEATLVQVLETVIHETKESIKNLREDHLHAEADWTKVKALVGVSEFAKIVLSKTSTGKTILNQLKPEQQKDLDYLENYISHHSHVDTVALQIEIRHRFLAILRGLYWHQYKGGQASAAAVFKLIQSADYSIDHEENPMRDWEHLEKYLISGWQLKLLAYLRKAPAIGQFVITMMYNRIAYAYEIAITFKECHKLARMLIGKVMASSKSTEAVRKIMRESRSQIKKCTKFIDEHVSDSVSEAVRTIHTNRAAYTVMCRQAKVVDSYLRQGMITEKESSEMKAFIGKNKHTLLSNTFFHKPDLYEYLRGLGDFEEVSNESVKYLSVNCRATVYNKGELIFDDESVAKGINLLMSGRAKECSVVTRDKIRHAPGNFMAAQNHFFEEEATSFIVADSSAYVALIPNHVLSRDDFPEEILSRIRHFATASTLALRMSRLPSEFNDYDYNNWLSFAYTHDVVASAKGEIIEIEFGAILLSGSLTTNDEVGLQFTSVCYIGPGDFKSTQPLHLIHLTSEVANYNQNITSSFGRKNLGSTINLLIASQKSELKNEMRTA